MKLFAGHTRRELEEMLAKDRIVIKTFYEELAKLGIMPEGIFVWTKKDTKRFARGILDRLNGK